MVGIVALLSLDVKKILVIDDEEWLREMVQLALRQKGLEVVEAENGAVGIEIARKELPDLILCDVNMERVDGYLTLSALRNEPTTGCSKAQQCNSVCFNLCCNALRRKYRQYFFWINCEPNGAATGHVPPEAISSGKVEKSWYLLENTFNRLPAVVAVCDRRGVHTYARR